MERKIGETFEYEGKKLRVEADGDSDCKKCCLNGLCPDINPNIIGECVNIHRQDKTSVVFVEINDEHPQKTEEIKERKVGEVFEYEGRKLKVVEAEIRCGNCFFHKGCCTRINRTTGECKSSKRSDNESVVFVEVKDEQPQKLNLCEILKYCPQGETFWSPLLGDVKLYYTDQEAEKVVVTAVSNVNWSINADGTIPIESFTSPEIMLYPSRELRDWTKVKYEKKKERFDPKTLKAFDRVVVRNIQSNTWRIEYFSHIDERCKTYPFYCSADNYAYCIPYNDDTKHLVGTTDEAPVFYRYWED